MNDAGKFRILVVDDEASVLVTYRMILEQQGYVVAAYSTSREAIQAIEQQNFDAVLCDYSLEEQHTGFEVIAAARQRDPEVPAALLTGYATKETADEADARKIGIMFKPIEIEEFLATTSTMLRRNHGNANQETSDEKNGQPQAGDEGRGHRDSRARRRSTTGPFKN